MDEIGAKELDILLGALGEQLLRRSSVPTELVVCGGAALSALGLIPRTTRDVDILAFVVNGEVRKADPFPDSLAAAVARVAADFHLPSMWLNPGPTSLVDGGLP